MPASSVDSLTTFPPFNSQAKAPDDKRDSPLEFTFDSGLDDDMASTQSPFIKAEPDDFNNYNANQYMNFNNNNHGHMSQSGGNMNVNPANLTNGGGNNFMSSSYIADDELADLNIDSTPQFGNDVQFQNFLQQQHMPQPNTFSHTPDGAPMQSPFNGDFNYAQFRAAPGQQQFGHSLPTQSQGFRHPHMGVDRKVSDSRSPATPNTPGMQHLTVNDDVHPKMQQIGHRQHSSIGNGWESTPSGHSWGESSPFPSPNGQPQHPQIEAVLRGTHHHHKVASSLPTKMEPGFGAPTTNTVEAKRRRRRESHNMVERRRRDNINERIQDLGTLVPQHRLEDEKVRKHLQTNAPLSPSIANSGMSPPNASLLGTSARRAAGNITQGLPLEEKDKGPNKGDILNGSVAWTRDMLWFMHKKLNQEQQLKTYIQELGGQWPFDMTDDEQRMTSEFLEVLQKHEPAGGFAGYTRGPGSGLRVPGFTNLNGDSISNVEAQNLTIPALSPGFRPGGSGMSSGLSHDSANYNWTNDPKEEDEFGIGMEMQ